MYGGWFATASRISCPAISKEVERNRERETMWTLTLYGCHGLDTTDPVASGGARTAALGDVLHLRHLLAFIGLIGRLVKKILSVFDIYLLADKSSGGVTGNRRPSGGSVGRSFRRTIPDRDVD